MAVPLFAGTIWHSTGIKHIILPVSQDSYKAMGYTGKFTFQMKGTKSSRAVTASYTVK